MISAPSHSPGSVSRAVSGSSGMRVQQSSSGTDKAIEDCRAHPVNVFPPSVWHKESNCNTKLSVISAIRCWSSGLVIIKGLASGMPCGLLAISILEFLNEGTFPLTTSFRGFALANRSCWFIGKSSLSEWFKFRIRTTRPGIHSGGFRYSSPAQGKRSEGHVLTHREFGPHFQ